MARASATDHDPVRVYSGPDRGKEVVFGPVADPGLNVTRQVGGIDNVAIDIEIETAGPQLAFLDHPADVRRVACGAGRYVVGQVVAVLGRRSRRWDRNRSGDAVRGLMANASRIRPITLGLKSGTAFSTGSSVRKQTTIAPTSSWDIPLNRSATVAYGFPLPGNRPRCGDDVPERTVISTGSRRACPGSYG